MAKEDGGPAFPVIAENGLGHISDGMTLRDWFAGQYVTGLCQKWANADEAAANAYKFADAMLRERSRHD